MSLDREPTKCLCTRDIARRVAKNWVERGRERPHPPGLPRRHPPRWSLPPTYCVRPESVPWSILMEYWDWPQSRPEGGQQ
jgi:hypothetical protein